MKAFDVNEYRRTVLAKIKDDHSLADPATGDVMWVCAVESGASATEALKRLDDVHAAWQKDRNSPKYKGICAVLVGHREAYAQVLKNPEARAQASARHEEENAAKTAKAIEELNSVARDLLKARGGIPADRVPTLRAIAEQDGLGPEAFANWLAGQNVLAEERGVGAVPWEPMVRRQVREKLTALANADPAAAPRTATLLTFLGVAPNANGTQVRAAHARLAEANLRRQRDTVMTVTSELLAHVSKRMFSDDGLESYTASLHADAREEIRGPLRRAALVNGSVNASQFQALVMTVVGLQWGISQHVAKDIVAEAASSLSVPVEVSGDTTVVVCGTCGRPQSPGRKRNCQYCNTALFRECPQCNAKVEAATQICPQCNCNIALHVASVAAVNAAQEELAAGHPVAARTLCLNAIGGADPADAPPAMRAVLTEAGKAIEQAGTRWREVGTGGAGTRPWLSGASLAWLERNAADVVQPLTGKTVAAALAEVNELKAQIEDAVRQATAQPAGTVEAALLAMDARYPDAPPVTGALAKLPLDPPRDVQAQLDGYSVDVSWLAAPTRGVSYRVERQILFPEDKRTSHVVGTTSATSLEDAGVPVGVSVRYTVTAVAGPRTSPPATSPGAAVFIRGDIEAVAVEVLNGNVILTWPAAQLGAVKVEVERAVDPSSGIKAPVRRLIPHESGRLVDDKADTGVLYRYRVSLRYPTPDGSVTTTPGKSVEAMVVAPPVPVKELWASGTDEAGATTVSFQTVPIGEVTLYAGGTGWPAAGTRVSVSELDSVVHLNRARTVGTGRRRVTDSLARGRTTYRAVTVNGDQAVVGPELTYVAVPKARDVRVVADRGNEVVVGFELPEGVTEAFVAWRRDGEYPHKAAEEARDGAGSIRVTNTKLDIDGGVAIPAPLDGRGLFVVVFPAVRVGGELVAAQSGPSLVAREPRPVTVGYAVERAGMLRRKVHVQVHTRDGSPLPALEVHGVSTSGSRRTLDNIVPGVAASTERVLVTDPFGNSAPWTVELVSVAPKGSAVTVEHPSEDQRRISP